MLSYTFSKREKVLLVVLALILVGVAWFMLVYQGTAREAASLDAQIANVQTEIAVSNGRAAQVEQMRREIEQRKEAGMQPSVVPDYDNLAPLMAELNRVLSGTSSYSMSFDEVDAASGGAYVMRGIEFTFENASFAQAEATVESLVFGPYACSVDSLDVNSTSNGAVTTTIHIVYRERA